MTTDDGPPDHRGCPLCRGAALEQKLKFPESLSKRKGTKGSRFACTSDGVGTHGPIYWCQACQVGYSPRPDLSWLQAQYAAVEDADYLDQEPYRLENASRLLSQVEQWQRPGRLFEIGSSVGILLEAAHRRGWEAAGIEASQWAVRTGRARYGVQLEVGTIESMPHQPGPVDCVIMVDVLEHLVDPQGALHRCRQWLAPGGVLAITTVNMTAPIARLMGTKWPGFMDMHLTYFSPTGLRTMLAQSGLDLLWLGPAPRRFALGYVGGRLLGSGPLGDLAAAGARLPLIRNVAVTLRTSDLLLVIAQRPLR